MMTNKKTLEIYDSFFEIVSSNVFIYVEGKSLDKFLYSSLKTLKKGNIVAVGPADKVNEKVVKDLSSIGIVDRDYNRKTKCNRVFKIRYYSIENIALVYNEGFNDLKKIIYKHTRLIILNPIKYKICNYTYSFNKEKKEHRGNFEIEKKKHHEQYHKYIRLNIYSKKRFLRLKDLKKVVNNYKTMIYEKMKKENYSNAWHIKQIIGKVNENDILSYKVHKTIKKYFKEMYKIQKLKLY